MGVMMSLADLFLFVGLVAIITFASTFILMAVLAEAGLFVGPVVGLLIVAPLLYRDYFAPKALTSPENAASISISVENVEVCLALGTLTARGLCLEAYAQEAMHRRAKP